MSARHSGASSRGALVAVSAAVGVLVALAAVVALEPAGARALLTMEPLPRAGLGVEWSPRTLWPADLQAVATDRLAGLLAALFLGPLALATLNALVLLAEGGAARRSELAVRAALGESPGSIVRSLLSEVRTLAAGGLVFGVLLGLAVGGVLRLTWPGTLAGWDTAAPTSALVLLLLLTILLAGAHVATGLRVAASRALADALRSGTRATADARAVFVRRVLAAAQTAVAGAVTLCAGALALGLGGGEAGGNGSPADVVVVPVEAGARGDWGPLLASLSELPELRAGTLSTPGALVGLGIQDIALADCGFCVRGLMLVPVLPVRVDHHAVAPGYFEAVGIEVVEGRGFDARDGPGSEPVAVVSRRFAQTSFEDGRPIGRRVRVGGDDAWVRVVGVVDDVSWPIPGSEERPREAIYLSALQSVPRSADLVLAGPEAAVRSALDRVAAAGVGSAPAVPLAAARSAAAAPLGWLRAVAAGLAVLCLLLAAYGIHTTALQVGRRRIPELAVRRALGADARHVVRAVLRERLRLTAWGVATMIFVGSLGVALLRRAAGGVPQPGPAAYVAVGLLLTGVALAASLAAAREAVRVEPATALE